MTDKRLAEMTPHELREVWTCSLSHYGPDGVGRWCHALIQRATREAREGCVDQAVSEAMVAAGAKAIWDSYSERLSPRGTWEMALTFTDYARIAITAALAASPTEVRDG
jgi:hypothetical protein